MAPQSSVKASAPAAAPAAVPDPYRAIFEHADIGMALSSLEGRPLHCNAALVRLLGYSAEELTGLSIADLSHADDIARSESLFRELAAGRRDCYRIEKRYRRKDRGIVHAEIGVRLVRDAAGRPHYAVGVVQDVGDRRLAERNRAQLAAIVDSSQDAIISKTLDGIITSWNAAATRMFGYTADEAIGQPVLMLIPPDRREEETAILARLRRGEPIESYETVRRRKDGGQVDISLTISPLRDGAGRIVGASKIARDIGAARAAERVLRESETRYRSLVEASGAIVFNSDAQARWLQPHPRWEAYTGQTFEQYRDHGWLRAIHEDDQGRITQLVHDAIARSAPVEAEGRLWHAPSRSWRHQEARAVPIRDADGAVREWVGTCADVHARKEFEEVLRTADRRKDEFMAVLAHELRNPLAPIANTLEILRVEGVDPGTARELADVARRQVAHLVRLVDDLMESSRISRGIIELKREPLLLAAAVQAAVEIARPLVDERRHRLDIELPGQHLLVHGDRTRLTQVIANLLNNAAKYTPPGGRIALSAAREQGQAVLRVSDNGAGIEPHLLGWIFEMFTQADRSPERSRGGLGIGLSLVRQLVELHGGSVEARSEGRGRGSEFVVRLPLVPEHAERPAAVERPRLTMRPRRVLIADDNRDAARLLAVLLRAMGQEVRVAHDGVEALEQAAATRPDLVLMDLGMPRLSGYDAARRLRAEPWGHDLLLVALTGWGQESDRQRSREAGFDHHLVKPVSAETLQQLLATGLPRRAA